MSCSAVVETPLLAQAAPVILFALEHFRLRLSFLRCRAFPSPHAGSLVDLLTTYSSFSFHLPFVGTFM